METNPWTIIDEKFVYENNWIALHHYNVLNPNGGNGVYGKVHFKNIAIGIIAIDGDKNTWLVGQYRFPLNKYSWEICEGGCALNETPIAAAKRELMEETGLVASQWQQILEVDLSNSVTDEKAIIFIATNLSQLQSCPEETEQLQIKKVSIKDTFKMVANGDISDAVSVLALQKLELMLLKNEIQL